MAIESTRSFCGFQLADSMFSPLSADRKRIRKSMLIFGQPSQVEAPSAFQIQVL
jgi:hypothetical protein